MLPNCLASVVDWLCVRDVDAAQQGGESTAALDALASVIRSETCTVIRQRNCGDEFPTEHNGTLCLGSIVHALAIL